MNTTWTPTLELRETFGRCRLWLGGTAYGDGETLQEAADDLLDRLTAVSLSARRHGLAVTGETGAPDREWLTFLWEVSELALRGQDIRDKVFGATV